MKKNTVFGLLIIATVSVLAGCASLNQKADGLIATKWDKNEKSTALLYFDENVRIHKIDGKEPTNAYGQTTKLQGSGTEKAPKVQVAIPAGERKIVISYREGVTNDWEGEREFTYIFIAGRYYQLKASTNNDVHSGENLSEEEKLKRVEEAAKGGVAGIGNLIQTQTANAGRFAMDLEIIDITGGKKKNSPSQLITIK